MQGNTKITSKECRDIRSRSLHGESVHSIHEDFEVTKETIYYHIKGDCSHTEFPVPGYSQKTVSEEECSKARRLIQKDLTLDDVAEEIGVTRSAIGYHTRGECDHDVEEETRIVTENSVPVVDEGECKDLTELYKDVESVIEVSRITQSKEDKRARSRATIRVHVSGECDHDTESLKIKKNRKEGRNADASETDCSEMRKLARKGLRIAAVSDRTGFFTNTVRKHLFGYCSHEIDEDPIPEKFRNNSPSQIAPLTCLRIRKMYYGENKHVGQIKEELYGDPSEDAIQNHILGDCHHELKDATLEDV